MAVKKAGKSEAEETGQKKVMKKKKRGIPVEKQAILIIDGDESDRGLRKKAKAVKEKKKGLRRRKHSPQGGTKEEKKKKKRDPEDLKNEAIVIESGSDSEDLIENRGMPKKAAKARLPWEGGGACEEALRRFGQRKGPESAEGVGKRRKRKRKRKWEEEHKSTCCLKLHREGNGAAPQKRTGTNVGAVSQDDDDDDAASPGRKKRPTLVTNVAPKRKPPALENEGSGGGIPGQRKAQGKRRASGCEGRRADSVAQASEEDGTRAGVRKKERKKPPEEDAASVAAPAKSRGNNPGVSKESLRKAKSRKTRVFQEQRVGLIQGSGAEGVGKATKKKAVRTKVANHRTALLEEQGKKRKTPKYKHVNELTVTSNMGRCEESGEQHMKKREKMGRGRADSCGEEPCLKKGRLKKETEVREDEIKVVAFKKGNCDEINIDKSRRQALQEEIDRESGRTKAIEEEREWESHFGQWSTASFGSSERKDKFLRLLGGSKKSPSVSAQGPPVRATKPSMALGWKKEQDLQRGLQAEFEAAINRKHHRSVGLGFQSATWKATHIDKYASKSIKFED